MIVIVEFQRWTQVRYRQHFDPPIPVATNPIVFDRFVVVQILGFVTDFAIILIQNGEK